MNSFEQSPPSFNEIELKDIAARLFSVEGKTKPLVSERDQNVRLTNAEGDYVLKIANPGEEREFLIFQNAALKHLAAYGRDVTVPQVMTGKTGEGVQSVEAGNKEYSVRLFSFLQGSLFSQVEKGPELLRDLGRFLGRLSTALQGFMHPAAIRPDFLWNLDNVLCCRAYIGDIQDSEHKTLVERFFDRYERHVVPVLPGLRSAVIHNDANDQNLLVDDRGVSRISGLIDFGDMVYAKQVNELAVVLAYALMDVPDPIDAACAIIRGYTAEFSLSETELEVLFDLVAMRLVMSVCISSHRSTHFPDNEYLTVSQAPAFRLLAQLDTFDRKHLIAVARKSGGFAAVPNLNKIVSWLQSSGCQPQKITSLDLMMEPRALLSQSAIEEVAAGRGDGIRERLLDNGATYAVAPYGGEPASDNTRISLGIHFCMTAETTVLAPLAGRVASATESMTRGVTIIIEHQAGDGGPLFYTVYGNLSGSGASAVREGQAVVAGDVLGRLDNGLAGFGHLRFQVLSSLISSEQMSAGYCEGCQWSVWSDICLDPNLLIGLPPETFIVDPRPPQAMMAERANLLGPSLGVAYKKKIKIVRGRGAYLFDHSGRAYLDCVNNITHVGHCHPRVVEALSRQAAILNTNTRYLSENIHNLAARLLGTMPDPLSVIFFVNSGSEANELALRLARTATGRKSMVVLDWAYHGNTGGLVDISPYKFNRKGGGGRPDHVRIADFPDPYRGPNKGYGEESGKAYARSVENCIQDLIEQTGEGPAAFIAESMAGVGGQVIYPDAYFRHAYAVARRAGALCIADEVQVGFGRTGAHMWAFEQQGVVPDIVTLGKPMGNGHPLAAVVTTREIADAFANGMEYFNSFGGNPVSCAVGLAVLDVIEQEGLQENAYNTGMYLMKGLNEMAQRHRLIGDVRGAGLFVGAELVRDRDTLEPATREADRVIQYLRDKGVLLSTDGPWENVLKLKPPMVFGNTEADIFLEKLDRAFAQLENS